MLPDLHKHTSNAGVMILNENSPASGFDQRDWQESVIPRSSWLYTCWQVAVDYSFGLLVGLIVLLLLPVIALLIYLDSPGPIFYSQERLGFRGKPFRIYKFRSMRTDAECVGQAVWATSGDSRVTRAGKLMRATHMDELPQVYNILRGEMSLIGPRPEREVFASQWEAIEPRYRDRLNVKPGLTGWAQVKFGYGEEEKTELQKLEYDLYYIRHRSCPLDLRIMLSTFVEIGSCRGR